MLKRIVPGAFYVARNKWRSWLAVPPTLAEVEADVTSRLERVMTNPSLSDEQRRLLAEGELLAAQVLMEAARPNPRPHRLLVIPDPAEVLGYRVLEVAA